MLRRLSGKPESLSGPRRLELNGIGTYRIVFRLFTGMPFYSATMPAAALIAPQEASPSQGGMARLIEAPSAIKHICKPCK